MLKLVPSNYIRRSDVIFTSLIKKTGLVLQIQSRLLSNATECITKQLLCKDKKNDTLSNNAWQKAKRKRVYKPPRRK